MNYLILSMICAAVWVLFGLVYFLVQVRPWQNVLGISPTKRQRVVHWSNLAVALFVCIMTWPIVVATHLFPEL